MTAVGMDGLLESPVKGSNNKIHPNLDYPEYSTGNEKFSSGPDSGKYDSRKNFNTNNPMRDSKTELHSQESIFEKKK